MSSTTIKYHTADLEQTGKIYITYEVCKKNTRNSGKEKHLNSCIQYT